MNSTKRATSSHGPTVRIANETPQGWQRARLSTPVRVQAGKRYVVSYLAFSLPAVVAGVAANSYGVSDATYGYGVAVMVLIAITIVALARQRDPERA